MKVPFVDLQPQQKRIQTALQKKWKAIIDDKAYILGPALRSFESEFASYCGVKHAIGVSSGTDALIVALRWLKLKPGDEVITISTTFVATANAIALAGGTPVFVDIDPTTRNFDFNLLEKAVTRRTKAIVPVHLYGTPVDMDKVTRIAKKYSLTVVEDACQAHGAKFKKKKAGTMSMAGCFSFYPGKNLGAYGEAGMIVTNDDAFAEFARKFINHGGIAKYTHEFIGANYRMDSLQAAVLSSKLPFLDEWNAMRRTVAHAYTVGLKNLPLRMPTDPLDATSVYHLYVVELQEGDRATFMRYLSERGVSTGIHYPTALHLLPMYRATKKQSLPVTEAYVEKIVSLPIFPGMTKVQIAYVIKVIRSYFSER